MSTQKQEKVKAFKWSGWIKPTVVKDDKSRYVLCKRMSGNGVSVYHYGYNKTRKST